VASEGRFAGPQMRDCGIEWNHDLIERGARSLTERQDRAFCSRTADQSTAGGRAKKAAKAAARGSQEMAQRSSGGDVEFFTNPTRRA